MVGIYMVLYSSHGVGWAVYSAARGFHVSVISNSHRFDTRFDMTSVIVWGTLFLISRYEKE
jgi:hypothetical protein